MQNTLIQQETIGEINTLLIEELTINDEVLSASKEVEEYLSTYLYTEKPKTIGDNVEIREKSFKMTVFKKPLTVHFNVINYDFPNEFHLRDYIRKEMVDTECTSSFMRGLKRNTGFCNIISLSVKQRPTSKFSNNNNKNGIIRQI